MATTAPTTRPALGRSVRANLPTAELYEDAIRHGEGLVAADGPLVVRTGQAHRPLARGQVHRRRAVEPRQDLVGPGQPADLRGALRAAAGAPRRVLRRPRPVQPGLLHRRGRGASPLAAGLHRDGLGEHLRAQPVPPADRRTSCAGFAPNFTIICVPSFQADPATEGTRTGTAILVHLRRMEIIIVGTEYAGEIKKSAFTVMNYLMPDEGVLPMHSAINVGQDGDAAVFFGLSGTGKTTLSADPLRSLIGDDEHGWGDGITLQLRGRLLRQDDPPLADVRAGHLPDDAPLRDGPRERRPRPADARARPRLGAVHREHPRRLSARLHRQRRRDRDRRARRGRSSS